ncbi:translation machinery-associated protein 64 [[Candida] jaroonii]|uniref:Translation machinery-associated protein 64 n=1 Tax=[Candida] jaroonii TaxID=467808 RepID=A0ACA9YD48_9ASCO|nr:translation machinery-associated protein 64 [[Candida] jaroonii]
MFKKNPQPKASANIKSSERRKLLGSICEAYDIPKDKLSKEAELKLLPSVIKQASFKSVQGFQGTIYYNTDETPLYFKSRDSQMYPSVFTCWENGYLLPLVVTHEKVIDHLKGGANLMLPGCLLPFPKEIARGNVVGIIDYKNPGVVIAVGEANIDLGKITELTQGVAVTVFHVVGDELCKLNKLVDIDEPKEVDVSEPWKGEGSEDAEGNSETQEEVPSEAVSETESEIPQTQSDNQPQTQSDIDMNDLAEQVNTLTVEEIDNFFTRSLLQSIKLDDIETPINASNFMSNHVLKNLPQIDSQYKNIKKTSWKKTGKFLKAMVKLGYIQVKGKDDDLTIISHIPKTDAIITGFNTHKISKSKESDKKKIDTLKVVQLYQPTNKYRMFFNKLDQQYNQCYTITELKTLINQYISKFNLVDTKPQNIKIDENLKEILGNSATIARNEIVAKFIKYATLKYVVLKPGQSLEDDIEIFSGETPKIEIICETKIGRKTVTRVKNFEKFWIKPHIIEEDLRNLCQGSSTLEKIDKFTEVIVQGPHYKSIQDYLINKGVPGNCILYTDKRKNKKRK